MFTDFTSNLIPISSLTFLFLTLILIYCISMKSDRSVILIDCRFWKFKSDSCIIGFRNGNSRLSTLLSAMRLVLLMVVRCELFYILVIYLDELVFLLFFTLLFISLHFHHILHLYYQLWLYCSNWLVFNKKLVYRQTTSFFLDLLIIHYTFKSNI
jgi:hypothetical protein